MRHIPWIGLAALVAMFVIPFLPPWLFEGPRTIRHWPRQHICGVCEAPWSRGHRCEPATSNLVLRGELRRLQSLERQDNPGNSM